MTTVQDVLIKILRAELNGTELDASAEKQLISDKLAALYVLSKRHDVAHIVASFLYRSRLLADEQLFSKFNREEIVAVYRNELAKYTYDQICDAFDESQIPYIPLKGLVLRAYYPQEGMRTSCDLDILVRENDVDRAMDALIQRGFKCGDRHYHDVSLYAPNKTHLELHFSIKENSSALDCVLKDAWEYATPVQGSLYEFSKEFFLLHMFAHMSYHFLSGGCGIRSLMDIWVMNHKMGISYEDAQEILERAGLYQFAKEFSILSESCFSGGKKDDFSDTLFMYAFSGGAYGTAQNKIAVKKMETSSTVRYMLKRLFLPYKNMAALFPVLKKAPILLPVFWGVRFFRMIFAGKFKIAVSEVKIANRVSASEIEVIQYMKNQLGLS